MVRNEPSDRQDRRIQRRKLRRMWASLREEKARLDAIPVYSTKRVRYIGRDGIDVTDEVMPRIILVVGAVLAAMIVLVFSV